jgi:cell division protein FtsQ
MIAEQLLGKLRPGGTARAIRARARDVRTRDGRAAGRARAGRRRRIALLAVIALGGLLGGGFLWFRDSPLVAVEQVNVFGASGPDAGQIRSALLQAARSMTTLDVRMSALRTAVLPYPAVKDLKVSTQFPHGMRIRVIEQEPVGVVLAAGHTTAVAGDGTLLHDVVASSSLPTIPLRVPPGGSRLSDSGALAAVAALAAAPTAILTKISQVTTVSSHGLVAQIRGGPSIYFGGADQLRAKWTAAIAVLADPGSMAALYIDVTDPHRPAAGAATAQGAGTGTSVAGTIGTASTSQGLSGPPAAAVSSTSGG